MITALPHPGNHDQDEESMAVPFGTEEIEVTRGGVFLSRFDLDHDLIELKIDQG